MACLEQVLKDIKALQARSKGTTSPRLPMTPELLSRIQWVWVNGQHSPDHVTLQVAALLCFFSFLRAGEIAVPSDTTYDEGMHLNFSDVAVDLHENP